MPRLAAAAACVVLLALQASGRAQTPQASDSVQQLLGDLEAALRDGRMAEFIATSGSLLAPDDRAHLEQFIGPAHTTAATVRERARDRAVVLADVFVATGDRARLANWQIETGLDTASGRRVMTALRELSSFDELVRLSLDAKRQFALRDFTFQASDFTLTFPRGVAFVADVADGTTALVLRGAGRVRFAPPDPTEQGQLRIFAGRPALEIDVGAVFIRVPPLELAERIRAGSLQPVGAVNAGDLRDATAVFRAQVGLSFHFALGDLSADQWSIPPQTGSVLVDFHTRRFGWLTFAETPEDPENISLFDRARRRQISLYPSASQIARHGRFYTDDDDAPFVAEHTALDLQFDPERRWLSGRASIRLSLRRPAASLTLRLAGPLVITSVSSPEHGPLLFLRASGQPVFVVGLPEALESKSVVTLDVQYHGRLDPQRLDREAVTVGQEPPERVEASDFAFVIEPRYLYSGRSAWYPQGSTPRHATASLRLTVPAGFEVLATGERTSATVSPMPGPASAVRTVEYRADRPVRYLACLVTRLTAVGSALAHVSAPGTNGSGVVAIDVLNSPRQANRRRVLPAEVARIVEYYAEILGEAPYPSFSLAVLEDTLPGGHSPAYFALINQPHPATPLVWANDPVAFSDAPGFFLAHEVAHQWWGQAVGTKNYREQWISEGLAQYMAWLYTTTTLGPETGRRLMSRMRDTAMALVDQGPITLGYRLGHLRGDSRIFRGTAYNKTAVVLHMLRRLVGDDAFFRGLRRVYAAGRFQKIGTDDVRQAFQAETSIELSRFFEVWFFGANIPAVHVGLVTSADGRSVVHVEQVGEASVFPLGLAIELADGSRQHVTVPVVEATADVAVASSRAIRRVVIDDDMTMVRSAR